MAKGLGHQAAALHRADTLHLRPVELRRRALEGISAVPGKTGFSEVSLMVMAGVPKPPNHGIGAKTC